MNWKATLSAMAMSLAALLPPAMPAGAATSATESSVAVEVALITAENWVSPGAATISAGLAMSMSEGWKTYWRSPGEVGLPPEMDFSASDNVAGFEILWPAPDRFTAFGIQNFGYSGDVVLPVRITLERPGEAASLRTDVNLLVCSDVCVPNDFTLAIDLPANATADGAIDQDSAARIAEFVALVPFEGPSEMATDISSFLDEEGRTLTVTASAARPFTDPDVFPEMGEYTSFGVPDIRLGSGQTELWAQLPILGLDEEAPDVPMITITDGADAVTMPATALDAMPVAPFALLQAQTTLATLAWIALLAFGGGLVLNVMPCVLPVLSIKLASVVSGGGKSRGAIRRSFLASGLGVMAFMWFLAAATFGLQRLGVTVGWGLQFQNPTFLALMVVILAIFAANMLGMFEISLPSGLQTRLANSGARGGHTGDFATGAFAAVLATPCSAPFLGTAIAFALTGGIVDIAVVFTGLGLGLALPYFAVSAWPRLAQIMPKPGRWMLALKAVLGLLLIATASWLIWVMYGVAGQTATYAVVGLTLALVALIALRRIPSTPKWAGAAILALAPIVAAGQLAEQGASETAGSATEWVAFDRAQIARYVSQGEVVFVDVTADWCLTCQANKILVLDREPVVSELAAPGVVAMRADWTRPNEDISRYLASFDRYGIPFNAVYGPGAPEGIVLSEILSTEAVMDALREAATRSVASGS